jgi:RNA polymerase sigma factor for flagellar operon FliA
MQMLSTSSTPGPRKHFLLAEHWRRYMETRDQATRDHLILAYAPIVKYVAGNIASKMPQHVELADLVSYGLSGLINAVERFDPERGVAFESYASQRIRGAIYDELRTLDWVPRAVRAEARALSDATGKLVTLLQRVPTDGEVAAELGLDAEEYDASLQRVADSHLVALDKQWNTSGDGDTAELALVDTLADDHAVDPAASADAVDLRDRIAVAIQQLPDRQQVILGLRYHQELSLGEIGGVLGISESRVCQLHAKAVVLLRALLEDERDTPG